jgi:hypothetical protein
MKNTQKRSIKIRRLKKPVKKPKKITVKNSKEGFNVQKS